MGSYGLRRFIAAVHSLSKSVPGACSRANAVAAGGAGKEGDENCRNVTNFVETCRHRFILCPAFSDGSGADGG